MKLTLEGISKDRAAYEAAGYKLPAFDYEVVKENTKNRPVWIHFGAGYMRITACIMRCKIVMPNRHTGELENRTAHTAYQLRCIEQIQRNGRIAYVYGSCTTVRIVFFGDEQDVTVYISH